MACENVLSEAKALGEEDASRLQRADIFSKTFTDFYNRETFFLRLVPLARPAHGTQCAVGAGPPRVRSAALTPLNGRASPVISVTVPVVPTRYRCSVAVFQCLPVPGQTHLPSVPVLRRFPQPFRNVLNPNNNRNHQSHILQPREANHAEKSHRRSPLSRA